MTVFFVTDDYRRLAFDLVSTPFAPVPKLLIGLGLWLSPPSECHPLPQLLHKQDHVIQLPSLRIKYRKSQCVPDIFVIAHVPELLPDVHVC
jgi:hypothetical protein